MRGGTWMGQLNGWAPMRSTLAAGPAAALSRFLLRLFLRSLSGPLRRGHLREKDTVAPLQLVPLLYHVLLRDNRRNDRVEQRLDA